MTNEKISNNEINKEFQDRILFQKSAVELKKEIDSLVSLISKKKEIRIIDSSIDFIKKKSLNLTDLLKERIKKYPESQQTRQEHHLNKNNDSCQTDINKIKNHLIESTNSLLQDSISGKIGFNHPQDIINHLEEITEKIELLKSIMEKQN